LQAKTTAGHQLRIDGSNATTMHVIQFDTLPDGSDALEPFFANLPESSFVSDVAYRDVMDLELSFLGDGNAAQFEAVVQATNFTANLDSYYFRLLLDGAVLPMPEGYLTLRGGEYGQVNLGGTMPSLPPGLHTLTLQAKTTAGNQVRIDGTNATNLRAILFRALPDSTPAPQPQPQPIPPTPIRRPASLALFTSKRGRLRKVGYRVVANDGTVLREIVSPYQKPTYTALAASLQDGNGDGVPDAVLFTARAGKCITRLPRLFTPSGPAGILATRATTSAVCLAQVRSLAPSG
jgi:hypothetical protein